MNQIGEEILSGCTLENGKLVLGDQLFLDVGKRIRESNDKKGWGTALIALVGRLRVVPGAGPAAERVTALAAIALGDAELNAILQRELMKR
jgi:hypothetical protein